MNEAHSSISKADSYETMGEFWDRVDLNACWDKTRAAEFDIDLKDDIMLYPMPRDLSDQVRDEAKSKGVPSSDLLESWIREKLDGD